MMQNGQGKSATLGKLPVRKQSKALYATEGIRIKPEYNVFMWMVSWDYNQVELLKSCKPEATLTMNICTIAQFFWCLLFHPEWNGSFAAKQGVENAT